MQRFGSLLLLPGLALIATFLVVPSVDTLLSSAFDPEFSAKHFIALWERTAYFQVLARTITVALVVAFLCALIGYPIAYYISQQPPKTQVWLLYLFLIPMWMSALIRSYVWIVLIGREGIVNNVLMSISLIDTPLKMMYTTGAVYIAMVQIMLPIQVFNSYSAMKDVDPDLIRAARVLGARPGQAMRRVFLPLSIQGTSTGAAIVFMMSTGFFVTPALVGGRQDIMLGNLITFHVERMNPGFAAALGIALLASALIGVIFIKKMGSLIARKLV
ncbi:putative spermidine/putrescine transport system permease protein [Bosea sp. OK403]|uniref:ABC transporter permease n=1 Tax=Bosea sp. OK403 TaxID=1855286 RepID=UPI0008F2A05B|nr:ABC transporter permease [Bosea sp. OK403]SFJ73415.1 putative spermidine/putrescine transport system permease protein [Bosea sp. OK403]